MQNLHNLQATSHTYKFGIRALIFLLLLGFNCLQVHVMLTRLKLKGGEGNILVASPQVRSRTRRENLPQYPPKILPQIAVEASTPMSHEGEPENMSEGEKTFKKAFFDMKRMVKVLYEERSTRMQCESSNIPKEDKSSKGEEGDGDKPPKGNGNGEKPPSSAPS